jgi:tetratricopeptide (TPR) repeat protein
VRLVALTVVACASLLLSASLQAQDVPGCGALQNAYGPFDYRDPVSKRDNLPIVETFHFTPDVESLRHGSSGTVLGDLKYTLRAFPNHHRALRSIARYALEGGQIPYEDSIPSADCYFARAIAFRPDDEAVHVIYANYLFKRGERAQAREQYEEALRLAPESAEINYVAGLFFVDAGDLARAKKLAQVAYDSGYPLPGLKKKIAAAETADKRTAK